MRVWPERRNVSRPFRPNVLGFALAIAALTLVVAGSASSQPSAFSISAVAVQHDGRILAVGSAGDNSSDSVFAIERLNSDGRPDLGFGTNGMVTTNLSSSADVIRAVAIQDDGRIVVAGSSNGIGNFAVARYLPNGSLDTGFAGDGTAETSFGNSWNEAFGVALQDDGKIVVAGYQGGEGWPIFPYSYTVALVRYTADGVLDSGFGSEGKVVGGDFFAQARAVAIQRDDKIVVAGSSGRNEAGAFSTSRYTASGALDGSFGSGGTVSRRFSPGFVWSSGKDVAIQHNGTIIVAGVCEPDFFPFNTDYALVAYERDGRVDTGFGNAGEVRTDFGGREFLEAIALQPNGKIIAVGTYLVRYDKDGELDGQFGTDGKVDWSATSVALQRDGRIVAASASRIARFNRDGTTDTDFGNGGVVGN